MSNNEYNNRHNARAFGAGSRQTPDIFDQFLQNLGFYRKHIAPDSCSLFRAVSELEYDIQLYYAKTRKNATEFIRNNKQLFVKDIYENFESYLNNMTKPRTCGTLLELRALAYYHGANVILFEPFTEGRLIIFESCFVKTWRLFYVDDHFDTVFPMEYMEMAADCQAIVYEILYKNVFRLPDVEYAVERMLHDPEDNMIIYEQNESHHTVAKTVDGRQLELSTSKDTRCVLMHSHLCHFHNHENFDAIQQFFSIFGPEEGCRVYIGSHFRDGARKPNPLLSDPKISCVRQLLKMGITPFPYKIAKSLDRHIYRNVEFDIWVEMRIEKRNETVFENDPQYVTNLRDDVACHIEHIVPDKKSVLLSTIGKQEVRYIDATKFLKPLGTIKRGSRNRDRNVFYGLPQHNPPAVEGFNPLPTVESSTYMNTIARADRNAGMPVSAGFVSYAYQQPICQYMPSQEHYHPEASSVNQTYPDNRQHSVSVPASFFNPIATSAPLFYPANHPPYPPIQVPVLYDQPVALNQQHLAPVPYNFNSNQQQNISPEYGIFGDRMYQQMNNHHGLANLYPHASSGYAYENVPNETVSNNEPVPENVQGSNLTTWAARNN